MSFGSLGLHSSNDIFFRLATKPLKTCTGPECGSKCFKRKAKARTGAKHFCKALSSNPIENVRVSFPRSVLH